MLGQTCNASERTVNKKVVFVRHGETDWSMDLVSQGPSDPSLNEAGKLTIRRSASYLKSLPETWLMWSSPLIRTADTANILIEQGVNVSEHYAKDNIKERYFGDFRLDAKNPPDKETDLAFNARIASLVSDIEREPRPLIIVGHGKMFEKLCELLGVMPDMKINFGDVFHFTKLNGTWSITGPVNLLF